MRLLLAMILAGLALCGAGCGWLSFNVGDNISPAAPVSADPNFNALWDSSLQVLRDYHFSVDRTSPREGVITTFPLLSRQWFEFWRHDAVGLGDMIEDSVQTIYRQAKVSIHPVETATQAPAVGRYYLTVEVNIIRSDLADAQVHSTAEAHSLFLHPESVHRGFADVQPAEPGEVKPKGGPVPLGRDPKLEAVLTAKINDLGAKKMTIYPRPLSLPQE